MEGGRSVLFDASTYMLLEASGDSEAECFAGAEAEAGAAAEDDAQSCSYGPVSDSAGVNEVDAVGDDFQDVDFDDCSEEEEGEDGVVDQCCGGGKAAPTEDSVVAAALAKEKLYQSEGFEDSNVKLINEETDRLFWEACLAS